MEREVPVEAIRAVRSLAWNRYLLPLVERRIAYAEQVIRSYLTLQGVTTGQLGMFEVCLEEEQISITKLPPDGWEQIHLPEADVQQSSPTADTTIAEAVVVEDGITSVTSSTATLGQNGTQGKQFRCATHVSLPNNDRSTTHFL